MWEALFGKLRENSPLAVMVIGLFLLIVGAAGGWPKPQLQIHEPSWRIALAAMGVITIGLGALMLLRDKSEESNLNVKKYGFTIAYPKANNAVGNDFDVGGNYVSRPPGSIVIRALDLSPSSARCWPKNQVVEFDELAKTWSARLTGVRFVHGVNRIIVVAVTGRRGQILCDYYGEVADEISQLRKNYKDPSISLPGIPFPHPDLVECDRVTVRGA